MALVNIQHFNELISSIYWLFAKNAASWTHKKTPDPRKLPILLYQSIFPRRLKKSSEYFSSSSIQHHPGSSTGFDGESCDGDIEYAQDMDNNSGNFRSLKTTNSNSSSPTASIKFNVLLNNSDTHPSIHETPVEPAEISEKILSLKAKTKDALELMLDKLRSSRRSNLPKCKIETMGSYENPENEGTGTSKPTESLEPTEIAEISSKNDDEAMIYTMSNVEQGSEGRKETMRQLDELCVEANPSINRERPSTENQQETERILDSLFQNFSIAQGNVLKYLLMHLERPVVEKYNESSTQKSKADSPNYLEKGKSIQHTVCHVESGEKSIRKLSYSIKKLSAGKCSYHSKPPILSARKDVTRIMVCSEKQTGKDFDKNACTGEMEPITKIFENIKKTAEEKKLINSECKAVSFEEELNRIVESVKATIEQKYSIVGNEGVVEGGSRMQQEPRRSTVTHTSHGATCTNSHGIGGHEDVKSVPKRRKVVGKKNSVEKILKRSCACRDIAKKMRGQAREQAECMKTSQKPCPCNNKIKEHSGKTKEITEKKPLAELPKSVDREEKRKTTEDLRRTKREAEDRRLIKDRGKDDEKRYDARKRLSEHDKEIVEQVKRIRRVPEFVHPESKKDKAISGIDVRDEKISHNKGDRTIEDTKAAEEISNAEGQMTKAEDTRTAEIISKKEGRTIEEKEREIKGDEHYPTVVTDAQTIPDQIQDARFPEEKVEPQEASVLLRELRKPPEVSRSRKPDSQEGVTPINDIDATYMKPDTREDIDAEIKEEPPEEGGLPVEEAEPDAAEVVRTVSEYFSAIYDSEEQNGNESKVASSATKDAAEVFVPAKIASFIANEYQDEKKTSVDKEELTIVQEKSLGKLVKKISSAEIVSPSADDQRSAEVQRPQEEAEEISFENIPETDGEFTELLENIPEEKKGAKNMDATEAEELPEVGGVPVEETEPDITEIVQSVSDYVSAVHDFKDQEENELEEVSSPTEDATEIDPPAKIASFIADESREDKETSVDMEEPSIVPEKSSREIGGKISSAEKVSTSADDQRSTDVQQPHEEAEEIFFGNISETKGDFKESIENTPDGKEDVENIDVKNAEVTEAVQPASDYVSTIYDSKGQEENEVEDVSSPPKDATEILPPAKIVSFIEDEYREDDELFDEDKQTSFPERSVGELVPKIPSAEIMSPSADDQRSTLVQRSQEEALENVYGDIPETVEDFIKSTEIKEIHDSTKRDEKKRKDGYPSETQDSATRDETDRAGMPGAQVSRFKERIGKDAYASKERDSAKLDKIVRTETPEGAKSRGQVSGIQKQIEKDDYSHRKQESVKKDEKDRSGMPDGRASQIEEEMETHKVKKTASTEQGRDRMLEEKVSRLPSQIYRDGDYPRERKESAQQERRGRTSFQEDQGSELQSKLREEAYPSEQQESAKTDRGELVGVEDEVSDLQRGREAEKSEAQVPNLRERKKRVDSRTVNRSEGLGGPSMSKEKGRIYEKSPEKKDSALFAKSDGRGADKKAESPVSDLQGKRYTDKKLDSGKLGGGIRPEILKDQATVKIVRDDYKRMKLKPTEHNKTDEAGSLEDKILDNKLKPETDATRGKRPDEASQIEGQILDLDRKVDGTEQEGQIRRYEIPRSDMAKLIVATEDKRKRSDEETIEHLQKPKSSMKDNEQMLTSEVKQKPAEKIKQKGYISTEFSPKHLVDNEVSKTGKEVTSPSGTKSRSIGSADQKVLAGDLTFAHGIEEKKRPDAAKTGRQRLSVVGPEQVTAEMDIRKLDHKQTEKKLPIREESGWGSDVRLDIKHRSLIEVEQKPHRIQEKSRTGGDRSGSQKQSVNLSKRSLGERVRFESKDKSEMKKFRRESRTLATDEMREASRVREGENDDLTERSESSQDRRRSDSETKTHKLKKQSEYRRDKDSSKMKLYLEIPQKSEVIDKSVKRRIKYRDQSRKRSANMLKISEESQIKNKREPIGQKKEEWMIDTTKVRQKEDLSRKTIGSEERDKRESGALEEKRKKASRGIGFETNEGKRQADSEKLQKSKTAEGTDTKKNKTVVSTAKNTLESPKKLGLYTQKTSVQTPHPAEIQRELSLAEKQKKSTMPGEDKIATFKEDTKGKQIHRKLIKEAEDLREEPGKYLKTKGLGEKISREPISEEITEYSSSELQSHVLESVKENGRQKKIETKRTKINGIEALEEKKKLFKDQHSPSEPIRNLSVPDRRNEIPSKFIQKVLQESRETSRKEYVRDPSAHKKNLDSKEQDKIRSVTTAKARKDERIYKKDKTNFELLSEQSPDRRKTSPDHHLSTFLKDEATKEKPVGSLRPELATMKYKFPREEKVYEELRKERSAETKENEVEGLKKRKSRQSRSRILRRHRPFSSESEAEEIQRSTSIRERLLNEPDEHHIKINERILAKKKLPTTKQTIERTQTSEITEKREPEEGGMTKIIGEVRDEKFRTKTTDVTGKFKKTKELPERSKSKKALEETTTSSIQTSYQLGRHVDDEAKITDKGYISELERFEKLNLADQEPIKIQDRPDENLSMRKRETMLTKAVRRHGTNINEFEESKKLEESVSIERPKPQEELFDSKIKRAAPMSRKEIQGRRDEDQFTKDYDKIEKVKSREVRSVSVRKSDEENPRSASGEIIKTKKMTGRNLTQLQGKARRKEKLKRRKHFEQGRKLGRAIKDASGLDEYDESTSMEEVATKGKYHCTKNKRLIHGETIRQGSQAASIPLKKGRKRTSFTNKQWTKDRCRTSSKGAATKKLVDSEYKKPLTPDVVMRREYLERKYNRRRVEEMRRSRDFSKIRKNETSTESTDKKKLYELNSKMKKSFEEKHSSFDGDSIKGILHASAVRRQRKMDGKPTDLDEREITIAEKFGMEMPKRLNRDEFEKREGKKAHDSSMKDVRVKQNKHFKSTGTSESERESMRKKHLDKLKRKQKYNELRLMRLSRYHRLTAKCKELRRKMKDTRKRRHKTFSSDSSIVKIQSGKLLDGTEKDHQKFKKKERKSRDRKSERSRARKQLKPTSLIESLAKKTRSKIFDVEPSTQTELSTYSSHKQNSQDFERITSASGHSTRQSSRSDGSRHKKIRRKSLISTTRGKGLASTLRSQTAGNELNTSTEHSLVDVPRKDESNQQVTRYMMKSKVLVEQKSKLMGLKAYSSNGTEESTKSNQETSSTNPSHRKKHKLKCSRPKTRIRLIHTGELHKSAGESSSRSIQQKKSFQTKSDLSKSEDTLELKKKGKTGFEFSKGLERGKKPSGHKLKRKNEHEKLNLEKICEKKDHSSKGDQKDTSQKIIDELMLENQKSVITSEEYLVIGMGEPKKDSILPNQKEESRRIDMTRNSKVENEISVPVKISKEKIQSEISLSKKPSLIQRSKKELIKLLLLTRKFGREKIRLIMGKDKNRSVALKSPAVITTEQMGKTVEISTRSTTEMEKENQKQEITQSLSKYIGHDCGEVIGNDKVMKPLLGVPGDDSGMFSLGKTNAEKLDKNLEEIEIETATGSKMVCKCDINRPLDLKFGYSGILEDIAIEKALEIQTLLDVPLMTRTTTKLPFRYKRRYGKSFQRMGNMQRCSIPETEEEWSASSVIRIEDSAYRKDKMCFSPKISSSSLYHSTMTSLHRTPVAETQYLHGPSTTSTERFVGQIPSHQVTKYADPAYSKDSRRVQGLYGDGDDDSDSSEPSRESHDATKCDYIRSQCSCHSPEIWLSTYRSPQYSADKIDNFSTSDYLGTLSDAQCLELTESRTSLNYFSACQSRMTKNICSHCLKQSFNREPVFFGNYNRNSLRNRTFSLDSENMMKIKNNRGNCRCYSANTISKKQESFWELQNKVEESRTPISFQPNFSADFCNLMTPSPFSRLSVEGVEEKFRSIINLGKEELGRKFGTQDFTKYFYNVSVIQQGLVCEQISTEEVWSDEASKHKHSEKLKDSKESLREAESLNDENLSDLLDILTKSEQKFFGDEESSRNNAGPKYKKSLKFGKSRKKHFSMIRSFPIENGKKSSFNLKKIDKAPIVREGREVPIFPAISRKEKNVPSLKKTQNPLTAKQILKNMTYKKKKRTSMDDHSRFEDLTPYPTNTLLYYLPIEVLDSEIVVKAKKKDSLKKVVPVMKQIKKIIDWGKRLEGSVKSADDEVLMKDEKLVMAERNLLEQAKVIRSKLRRPEIDKSRLHLHRNDYEKMEESPEIVSEHPPPVLKKINSDIILEPDFLSQCEEESEESGSLGKGAEEISSLEDDATLVLERWKIYEKLKKYGETYYVIYLDREGLDHVSIKDVESIDHDLDDRPFRAFYDDYFNDLRVHVDNADKKLQGDMYLKNQNFIECRNSSIRVRLMRGQRFQRHLNPKKAKIIEIDCTNELNEIKICYEVKSSKECVCRPNICKKIQLESSDLSSLHVEKEDKLLDTNELCKECDACLEEPDTCRNPEKCTADEICRKRNSIFKRDSLSIIKKISDRSTQSEKNHAMTSFSS